jgi:hypothetical protein
MRRVATPPTVVARQSTQSIPFRLMTGSFYSGGSLDLASLSQQQVATIPDRHLDCFGKALQ